MGEAKLKEKVEPEEHGCNWIGIGVSIIFSISCSTAVGIAIYNHTHVSEAQKNIHRDVSYWDLKPMNETVRENIVVKIGCGMYGNGSHISGGFETQLDEFPWTALLEYKLKNGSSGFLCSGVLVNERFVMTNAQCLNESSGNKLINIRLGDHDLGSEVDCVHDGNTTIECAPAPINIEITKTSISPNNTQIGIIELAEPVQLNDFVKPICVPEDSRDPKDIYYTSGWYSSNERYRTDVKQKSKTRIVDRKLCAAIYRKYLNFEVDDRYICAGDSNQNVTRTCSEFLGDPLMKFNRVDKIWEVEGFLSNDACGNETEVNLPSLYIKVNNGEKDWILESIGMW